MSTDQLAAVGVCIGYAIVATVVVIATGVAVVNGAGALIRRWYP